MFGSRDNGSVKKIFSLGNDNFVKSSFFNHTNDISVKNTGRLFNPFAILTLCTYHECLYIYVYEYIKLIHIEFNI